MGITFSLIAVIGYRAMKIKTPPRRPDFRPVRAPLFAFFLVEPRKSESVR
jgi:hypothetical protein